MPRTRSQSSMCHITQSPGTGKSRMVDEMAKLVFTIPCNLLSAKHYIPGVSPNLLQSSSVLIYRQGTRIPLRILLLGCSIRSSQNICQKGTTPGTWHYSLLLFWTSFRGWGSQSFSRELIWLDHGIHILSATTGKHEIGFMTKYLTTSTDLMCRL
jgi:hypothetical protein